MEVGEWEVNRASGCHLLLAISGLRGGGGGGAMGNSSTDVTEENLFHPSRY